MSFFGLGDQDWVELDVEATEVSDTETLLARLEEHSDRIESDIGPFTVEVESFGVVRISGRRSYRARLDRNGRLLFTGLLDPDGPL